MISVIIPNELVRGPQEIFLLSKSWGIMSVKIFSEKGKYTVDFSNSYTWGSNKNGIVITQNVTFVGTHKGTDARDRS